MATQDVRGITIEESPASGPGVIVRRRPGVPVPDWSPRWLAWLVPLFVPTPGAAPLGWRRVAVAAALVVAGVVASLARTPNVFDVIYVEDGQRFLADAVARPFGATLFLPYSGYFQLAPRLLGEFAALAPVSNAAIVLAIEGAVANALLALLVYVASAALLRRPLLRLLVSVPVVLTPTAHLDLPNSITMLRWPIMYATFWMLLWVPARRAGQAVGLLVVVIAAFSDNVVPLLIPLVLARWLLRRERYALGAFLALAVGAVANLALVVTGASRHPSLLPRPNPPWAGAEWVLRPAPQAIVGERWAALPRPHTIIGVAPIAVGWLVLLGVVFVAWRRLTRPNWLLAGVACAYSVIIYTFVDMLTGFAIDRYTVPAVLLLLVAVAALVKPGEPAQGIPGVAEPSRWVNRAPAVVVSLIVLAACLANLRMLDYRSTGPRWSSEVEKARARCASEQLRTVDVPISPAHISPIWTASLPCRYLGA